MQCGTSRLRQSRLFLLLLGCVVAAAEPERPLHRPLARRERRTVSGAIKPDETAGIQSSLMQLTQAATTATRYCPGGIECGDLANKMIWNQSCWDCLAEYQELFCEKMSLNTPPTFIDACATEGRYRGAYCKKFAEVEPPVIHDGTRSGSSAILDPSLTYYEDCFFEGSEYKQIYCEKAKMAGQFKIECAKDANVGTEYCQGFATQLVGFQECNDKPGYMFLYCQTKQTATIWDTTCANHQESGAAYCEDFAIEDVVPKTDCVKYASYLKLFCTIQAKHNISQQTCASNPHTKGMYCGQLALQKNGLKECWAVQSFDVTYCNEISWCPPECQAIGGKCE